MSAQFKRYSQLSLFSLAANGLLLLVLGLLWQRDGAVSEVALASFSGASMQLLAKTPIPSDVGQQHKLNYQQWVDLLGQEAAVIADKRPENLAILLGDSITLWFSKDYLPGNYTWLNQGISGENTVGLLRRLNLLDTTQPQVIYVMIGINDILRGTGDETILANHRLIVSHLKRSHPRSRIVLQSILPHSAEQATWEGRDRLLKIPNQRIRNLNRQLEAIAKNEQIYFLDLYPLFADAQGNLKIELSTDGLHLNGEGYKVWSTALQIFNQVTHQRTAGR
ncbi:lysophospholipase [Spirulina subsalsa FACHB-351]|uniref:Lysophospholipase n=1 Tax=Spirulina subsalsa FACHB-351 TaxID=234711 RepID=A0ABT3L215_9CYAN|nr:SGNH/GDSL hydrolase family protein [Spirulina subsalsa]MCW6035546.1 lysophospholipase [Spirulina subsalsa FACHB-351]